MSSSVVAPGGCAGDEEDGPECGECDGECAGPVGAECSDDAADDGGNNAEHSEVAGGWVRFAVGVLRFHVGPFRGHEKGPR